MSLSPSAPVRGGSHSGSGASRRARRPDRGSIPRSRRLPLAVLCASLLMVILDGSIVTVALPEIQRDLGFSPAGLTWTVNGYLIAFGGLLLLAGRLGDLAGRRRVFVAGLIVFTAASVLCGLAAGPQTLVVARFLQGAGAALASAVSLGMIAVMFPEPRERGAAIGAFSFVGAVGASLGQVLGGVLTQALGWHAIFLINLPIGAVAAVLAVRVLPDDAGIGARRGSDALGAALVTAGLMVGVGTIVSAGGQGWTGARTVGGAALAVTLLAAFAVREATAKEPLLPPRVLRSRAVLGANLIQALMVFGGYGFQVMVALYLQQVLGYGPTRTGLAMLPAALSIAVVSLGLSARLNARFGEPRMLALGLALLVVALGLMARLPVDAAYPVHLLPTMLLAGGFGLAIAAATALAMATAGPRDAGVLSGLFSTTQQVGSALGVAVLSTLAARRTAGLLDARGSAPDAVATALTEGFRLGFGLGAAAVATGLVLTLVLFARYPRRVVG